MDHDDEATPLSDVELGAEIELAYTTLVELLGLAAARLGDDMISSTRDEDEIMDVVARLSVDPNPWLDDPRR